MTHVILVCLVIGLLFLGLVLDVKFYRGRDFSTYGMRERGQLRAQWKDAQSKYRIGTLFVLSAIGIATLFL